MITLRLLCQCYFRIFRFCYVLFLNADLVRSGLLTNLDRSTSNNTGPRFVQELIETVWCDLLIITCLLFFFSASMVWSILYQVSLFLELCKILPFDYTYHEFRVRTSETWFLKNHFCHVPLQSPWIMRVKTKLQCFFIGPHYESNIKETWHHSVRVIWFIYLMGKCCID